MDILLDTWATTMWRACWQGGLVVLVVWSICRLIPSMPARFQCWLWRLAILKFMAVLLVPWLLNVPLLPARSVAIQDLSLQEAEATPAATEIPISPMDHLEVRSKAIDQSKAIARPSVRELLCFAWIIGVAWSLLCLLAALHGTVRLRRQGHSTACTSLIEQLAVQGRLFGFRSLPRLLEVVGDGSPMLVGIFRPVILFPAHTLGRLSILEQKMVLGHELAHIKRSDLLWGLVASFVRAVFFFHPLVWLSERQLKFTQEVAADELAIAQQKHDPVGYGKLLVSVVGKLGPARLLSRMSVETIGSVRTLARRLLAMKRIGRVSRRIVIVSAIVLAGVVLIGLIPWRIVAAEPQQGTPSSQCASAQELKLALPKEPVTQYTVECRIIEANGLRNSPKLCLVEGRKAEVFVDSEIRLATAATVENGKKPADIPMIRQGAHVEITIVGRRPDRKMLVDASFELSKLRPGAFKAGQEAAVDSEKKRVIRWISFGETLTISLAQRGGETGRAEVVVNPATVSPASAITSIPATPALPRAIERPAAYAKAIAEVEKLGGKVTVDEKSSEKTVITVSLSGIPVTDAGLERLKGLTQPEWLDLIQWLDLSDTKVTDAGLEHLKGLSQLQELRLKGTKVTDGGVKKLRQALPKCKIVR